MRKHDAVNQASGVMRSGSFAPASLFNERIYELHDNSGSLMTTPTFHANPTPLRGEDAHNNRTLPSHVSN